MKSKKHKVDESSSEDDMEKFKQAVDGTLFTDAMFKNLNEKNRKDIPVAKETPKSMRYLNNEEQQIDLRISTQMQNHVGQKLSNIIGHMVEFTQVKGNNMHLPTVQGGIKLFKDSKHFLTTDAPDEVGLSRKDRKKIKRRKIEDESNESLENVAVSPQYILSGESTKHWKSRRKDKITKYKQNSNGCLISVE